MPTKAELIEKLQELDAVIAEKKAKAVSRLAYAEWRAYLWTECMSCGHRIVDEQGCAVCMPIKNMVNDSKYDDYRAKHNSRMKKAG